jgi:HK97 gp10 family phage protein
MSISVDLKFDSARMSRLHASLTSMSGQAIERILKKAVKTAIKPVLSDAKQSAPVETGMLQKSIISKDKKYSNGVLVIVGAESKKDPATGRNPANYLHLVHDGTKPHAIAGPCKIGSNWAIGIKHPGNRANPFLLRALDKNTPAVLSRFARSIKNSIIRELKK